MIVAVIIQELGSHARLSSKDAREMVEQAKELDSRFSKGNVQKTF